MAGVNDDTMISVAALNQEFVSKHPAGPHTQQAVSDWINKITSEARAALVPIIWNNDEEESKTVN